MTGARHATEAEPAAEPLVRFAGVTKSYDGETLVVHPLDLDIVRGEFLTLLGPSGSGKTTTLMMLAGFEAPTGGRIFLRGSEITRLPPHRRDIGMVFQSYALFPHMSVGENIAYPLKVRGVGQAEARRRVEAVLDVVRLPGIAGRRPAQLSGGQQQRVALARAIVFEPELILLDEPLGALDRQLRERMQYELKQLHERLGVSMIYVTHDQAEALTMSDRIAVFSGGRIQQLAAPADLYERPANAFVASFVGENNRLEGVVAGHEGDVHVVRLAGDLLIRAVSNGRIASGERVVLGIRPERILVGPAAPPGNSFEAVVERTVYLGEAIRIIASFRGGELAAKVAAGAVCGDLRPGAPVAIGWRTEDCRAFAMAD